MDGDWEGLEWNGRGQLRLFPPPIVVVVPNCRPEFDLGQLWNGNSTAIRSDNSNAAMISSRPHNIFT